MSIAQKSYKHKCGFKRSNETKHILSEFATIRNTGRVWVINDIEDKFVNPDNIPEGFRRGRNSNLENVSEIANKQLGNLVVYLFINISYGNYSRS